ncbi:MAG: peptidoglycan-associated lipoprotein Pal [Burkholderiaceae bacterium]|nr:peptidoglycan-associated lipoprotein Pal [Roseateles sp.]MBV8471539.1 peptidoglycan-associated lipoprotein Pal [Burkholderiaceae bacterium]
MHNMFAALLALGLLAACSSTPLGEKAPVEDKLAQPASSSLGAKAATGAASESKVQTVDLGAQLSSAVANQRVVYFDFDSFAVKDEYRSLLDAHAKRLSFDRKIHLSLEGHTDERGGREYNLALGQKRAEAVAQALGVLGVQASQIEPVSFGKEQPAVEGHDEAAWAKNRRVELKDK